MNTPTGHFVRHYFDMVVAMFLGMLVLGEPALLGARRGRRQLGRAHGRRTRADAARDGRHDDRADGRVDALPRPRLAPLERDGRLDADPTAGVIGLLWAGLVDGIGTLLAIEHLVMLPAMLVAMLLRRDEYSGHAHDHVPPTTAWLPE
jgi:hypothetical protein